MNTASIKKGTMRNYTFDAWLVFLPLIIAVVSALALRNHPGYMFLGLAAAYWIGSNTHAAVTYAKVIWNKPNRQKYYHFITWVPLLLFAICILIEAWAGAALIISIYYYTQLFHYVRQSYGLSSIYKKSSNDTTPNWLHQNTLYMFPLWGLCVSMHNGFFFFGEKVYSFSIGELGLLILGAYTAVISVLWLINQAQNFINKTFSVWYFLYIVSHYIVFYIGLIYIQDKTMAWVCVSLWHSVQYVLFAWNHFQYISNEKEEGEIEFLKFISKNIYLFTLFCFVTAGIFIYVLENVLSGATLWAVPVFFAVTLMFNFNHYILDAIIWRRPKKTAK